MNILLSNDDGYLAPGLTILAESLLKLGKVTVVAPDRNRSAASNSLTLDRPIRAAQAENGFVKVDGTPTDCVHLAITGLLDKEPDIVVSGPNAGPNMGDDVLYSGTVAAATEGRFLGFPAIAVSMCSYEPEYYETACIAVDKILAQLVRSPLPEDSILNVNVPDIPWAEVKGFQATRLGNRHKSEGVIKQTDPRGESVYWVGPPGEEQDAGEGTDFYATRNGFISITPLQIDLTRYDSLQNLKSWLEEVK
ncbi:MAG: 5'/3'-nucleotidase SurE [Gammaproteobacteria bacterium]|nr:5'/3'-nucleotidase SurE [Gammaproteobacteria bacterium]MCW8909879.1 5'/3'-nucleotidase SurE [Gammaproteobacteria bacterium]MCW9005093.1 5'/3'-nucleotidase SurE [Gammaproteobacteria bacterium]MCW9055611.1 5'/3'-nucleotidase SurE [Gammaproteobacteria bacterium]